jgi:hypothetical protein
MYGTPHWPLIEFSPNLEPATGAAETGGGRAAAQAAPALACKLAALYAQEMARRCVLLNTHPVHSAAHDSNDLDYTLAMTREALTVIRNALHAGRVDDVLEISLEPPIFRRMVQ